MASLVIKLLMLVSKSHYHVWSAPSLEGSAVAQGPREAHCYFSYSWNHPDTFGCSAQGTLGSPGPPFKPWQYNIIAKCEELHSLSLLLWFHPPLRCGRWPSCILLLLTATAQGTVWPCERHCSPYRATWGLGRGLTTGKVSAYARIPRSHSLWSKPSLNRPPPYVFLPTV